MFIPIRLELLLILHPSLTSLQIILCHLASWFGFTSNIFIIILMTLKPEGYSRKLGEQTLSQNLNSDLTCPVKGNPGLSVPV